MAQQWDADLYDDKHGFVAQFGRDLIALLQPGEGERILDLGCGTGELSWTIAQSGAEVVGIDNSPDMIASARGKYPQLQFLVADATDFHFDEPFDALFSNAVLHWVKGAEAVLRCSWRALKEGGRLVAEFGGQDNVQAILQALFGALEDAGRMVGGNPWYFPSIGTYATLMEKVGFRVSYAVHFERPTPLEDGERGLQNWMRMFGGTLLAGVPEEARETIIAEVERRLRPTLFRDGTWYADYRRIRVLGQKVSAE